jgi:hypothetical protein
MAEHETKAKVEVEVGPYDEGGTFLGQLVRFGGEEVGSYTDYAEARSSDDGSFYAATEAEAREYHPQLFAAIGDPNILELD